MLDCLILFLFGAVSLFYKKILLSRDPANIGEHVENAGTLFQHCPDNISA